MWTPEYYVRYLPLPAKVHATVLPNADGSFDIYINESFDARRRAEALAHELEHIRRDHFYRALSLAEKEAEAGAPVRFDPPPPPPPAPAGPPVYESPAALLSRWLAMATPEARALLARAAAALRPRL